MPAVGEKDVAAHLAGQRRVQLQQPGLHQAVAALPHVGHATQRGDAIEQRLAGLDVADNGAAGQFAQHRFGQQGQQLIAPHHAALAIDRANPIGIAIKGNAEIAALLAHHAFQIGQIGLHRGIGVMIGKTAIHVAEQQMVGAGQQAGQPFHHRAGGAVAAIPGDGEGAAAKIGQHRFDIAIHDIGDAG